jgi:uncharacterized protein (TIGR02466 family)
MTTENKQIEPQFYFSSGVYVTNLPQFLEVTETVANTYIDIQKKNNPTLNELAPVIMTSDMSNDENLHDFGITIAGTGYKILESQGYAIDKFEVFFTEMWCQEHYKHSIMEQHVHGNYQQQLVGFYFIDTPENCSLAAIHDPRSGKKQINLPEQDVSQITYASNAVYFKPEPGMLLITNSWLEHSFTRNGSETPMKFIHFGLGIQPAKALAPVVV